MPLSEGNINWIAKVGGVRPEDISRAISSDEPVNLDFKLGGKVYTDDEIKGEKEKMKQAGIEIGCKEIARISGIELSGGEKEPGIIAEKIKTGITSGMEEKYKNMTPPQELAEQITKTQQWEAKYNTLLETHEKTKKSVSEWEEKYNETKSKNAKKERDNQILSFLPEKLPINNGDALTVINASLTIGQEGESEIFSYNGKRLTDDLGDNLDLEKAVGHIVEDKGWTKKPGMGRDNEDGNFAVVGGKTPEQAHEIIKKKFTGRESCDEALDMYSKLTAPIG